MTTEPPATIPASQYPDRRSALGMTGRTMQFPPPRHIGVGDRAGGILKRARGTVGTLGLLVALCFVASLLLAAVWWGAGWVMTTAGI